jgi:hypothetical protein
LVADLQMVGETPNIDRIGQGLDLHGLRRHAELHLGALRVVGYSGLRRQPHIVERVRFILLLNLPSARYANGDVRLSVLKLESGPNRSVFLDAVKSFPDQPI